MVPLKEIERDRRVNAYLREHRAWLKEDIFMARQVVIVGWFVKLHPRMTWMDGLKNELRGRMQSVNANLERKRAYIQQ